jgi:2-keto-4-pentenoate hydratase/2-oxohepta-3-ene-1,7-dioic acid hydratase in catechol pathway
VKLVSLAPDGHLGVLDGEQVWPTDALGERLPRTMTDLLAGPPATLDAVRDAFAARDRSGGRSIGDVELLAPVPRPGKIIAVGLNYRGHAAEQDRPPPDHPVIFAKYASAVIGHRAEIRWDRALTQAVDYEAELAVIIGRTCRSVEPAQALEYVIGYTCLNDVSARDLQYSDRQFTRAKSLDTFCPMGPALVTGDEVGNPADLRVRCLVNGEVRQDASTSELVFGVAELISFCSRAFTLEPGDVIATGTPAGVGWFRKPPLMLRDGDEVVVEIERIGRLVNRCRELQANAS